jgi:pyruvate carboxylase
MEQPNDLPASCASACSTAFASGAKWGKHYAYLDSVRDIVSGILCDPTPGFDARLKDEIVRLRDQANKCIGLVLDASKREAHEICQ